LRILGWRAEIMGFDREINGCRGSRGLTAVPVSPTSPVWRGPSRLSSFARSFSDLYGPDVVKGSAFDSEAVRGREQRERDAQQQREGAENEKLSLTPE